MELYKHFEIIKKITLNEGYLVIDCISGLEFMVDKENCNQFIDKLEPGRLICVITDQIVQGRTVELHVKIRSTDFSIANATPLYTTLVINGYGRVALGFVQVWGRRTCISHL